MIDLRDKWSDQPFLEHFEELKSAIISTRSLINAGLALESTSETFIAGFAKNYNLERSFELCTRVLKKNVQFLESSSLSDKQQRLADLDSFRSINSYLKVELYMRLKSDLDLAKMI